MIERPFYCPRAQSAHHPCVVHDGRLAVADDGVCVFCGIDPAEELQRLAAMYVALKERLSDE